MVRPAECVVIANGLFPTDKRLCKLITDAVTVIACDGAVKSLHKLGLHPTAVVGDMDSISEELRQLYANKIYIDSNQETNDLTKAVVHARNMGCKEVIILGATGLREDHTLGNISLLATYAPWFDRIEMVSDFGLFTPISQSATLRSFPGQQVSLFSLHPTGKISSNGLLYPLRKRRLSGWWEGTLNEAKKDSFSLLLSPQASVIVFREMKK